MDREGDGEGVGPGLKHRVHVHRVDIGPIQQEEEYRFVPFSHHPSINQPIPLMGINS